MASAWEMVIGLEVHTELATATKLFCGCPNNFGDDPNTNVCPVCLGLPGSLPVLNEQVVELSMRLGRALGCEVRRSIFARKNYFYPDMPKDYQVSQYDLPINVEGSLELPSGRRIGIERAHIEEDTGKSTHVGGGGRITDAGHSLVDYNRAGVPLLEIVSKPDLRSADEARAYVSELRAILLATGASDAKMEEGSLRVDANVSVHHPGEPFGTRCEIKNLNSLRSLGRAIEYEAARQIDLIEAGAEPTRLLTHVEHNLAVEGARGLDPQRLAALVTMETDGELTATQAKAVLAEMVTTGDDPAAIAKAKGFEAMGADALTAVVDEVIAGNEQEWARYVDGDDKARGKLTGFFVGQVMKATRGQADGKAVTTLLRERAAAG